MTSTPIETPVNKCTQLRRISLTVIIRLFERMIFTFEIPKHLKSVVGGDQFTYKKGCNTTVALLRCQDYWLRGLDGYADYVFILSSISVRRLTLCRTTYYVTNLKHPISTMSSTGISQAKSFCQRCDHQFRQYQQGCPPRHFIGACPIFFDGQ